MNIKWYLMQLLPLKYSSTYGFCGGIYKSTWRMWFGKIFWLKHSAAVVNEEVSDG